MVVREFCAENFSAIPTAVAAGAERIELRDNLAVGGTTPSVGVMRAAAEFGRTHCVPVFVMIRPRGGGFVYDEAERQIMRDDIAAAVAAGADGIVLGALTSDGWVDESTVRELLAAGRAVSPRSGLEVTFHMAYDHIPRARQFEAIDLLAELGVTRILTHGSPTVGPIADNFEHLRQIVEYARGRVTIVIGGGVTAANLDDVVAATGTSEAHGTRIVSL